MRPLMFLLALCVVAGVALYCLTPEERLRIARAAQLLLRRIRDGVEMCRRRPDDPFFVQLRARVRWPLVTYGLAVAIVTVFASIAGDTRALADPATLVAWGGNVGPHTTDGERWRVLTSVFVHRDLLHLIVIVVALVQLGLILERAAGPFTFGIVFLAAGAFGSVVSVAAAPMTVVVGANGAVWGLYGLLLAIAVRGLLPRSGLAIPLRVLGRLAPMAVLFALYDVLTAAQASAASAGLSAGLVGGIALTRTVHDSTARLRRLAALGATGAVIVMTSALALRAVTDVRPVLGGVMASDERIAAEYDEAVLRFRNGRLSRRELAAVIEQSVLPQVKQSRDSVDALADVPAGDAWLVSAAQEYLTLRDESWRARAKALRSGGASELRSADATEQASLRLRETLRSAVPK